MIYAYRTKETSGDYVDAYNERWTVHTSSRILGKIGSCWQVFDSLAAALEEWGLTLIMPIDEELTEIE